MPDFAAPITLGPFGWYVFTVGSFLVGGGILATWHDWRERRRAAES